ncbi:MAG: hypothetical protein H0T95_00020 [Chthoniobacterales bacterium]|nr:hypothetical protein [Chthoniobacterales bacterium]
MAKETFDLPRRPTAVLTRRKVFLTGWDAADWEHGTKRSVRRVLPRKQADCWRLGKYHVNIRMTKSLLPSP